MCIILALNDQNTLIVQLFLSNILSRIKRYASITTHACLIYCFGQDLIPLLLMHMIQCRIWVRPVFYILGQVHLTLTKHDLDDPTQLQP